MIAQPKPTAALEPRQSRILREMEYGTTTVHRVAIFAGIAAGFVAPAMLTLERWGYVERAGSIDRAAAWRITTDGRRARALAGVTS